MVPHTFQAAEMGQKSWDGGEEGRSGTRNWERTRGRCSGKNLTVLAWTLSLVTSSFVSSGQSPVPVSDLSLKIRPVHHQAALRLTCDPAVKLDTVPGTVAVPFFFVAIIFRGREYCAPSPLHSWGRGVLHSPSEVGGCKLDTDLSSQGTATAPPYRFQGKIFPIQRLLPSVCPELIVS